MLKKEQKTDTIAWIEKKRKAMITTDFLFDLSASWQALLYMRKKWKGKMAWHNAQYVERGQKE